MQPTVIEVRGGVRRKRSKISHARSPTSPKPLRVYVYNLLFSDQGLVGQCSVQPSCRWYEVLQRKIDGAYPPDGITSTLKFTTTTMGGFLLM